jgi:CDP-glycerol glycerophosphotransferase (TagB/SpsB family)
MLNNVKIKKMLKSTIYKPLTQLNKVLPKKTNWIMLYIPSMGLRHNLKPLLDYLIENEYNKKYKIICAIEDLSFKGREAENVFYISKVKAQLVFMFCRHVFYTAGQIPIKPSSTQIVIHMNHGTSDLKAMGALTNINNGDEFFFTYILVPSEIYVPIVSAEYLCDEKNVKVCGEPMTDALFNKKMKYELGNYKKIIVWLPTFRQSKDLNYSDSSESLLPMFQMEDYDALNEYLKKYDFLLVVKLHTSQDTEGISTEKYSNILLLTNDQFVKRNFDLYELLPQTDALIGDYSSVSLQYLLLDKPLAFVVPDMEEYKEKRGFCFENPEDYMPGPIIKEKQQLYRFFDDIYFEKDEYIEERNRVRNIIFKYQDGENSKRVLELSDIKK